LVLAVRPYGADAQSIEKYFLDRVATVDGSAYRYLVFVPPGWSKSTPWPVILFLHGVGGYGSVGVNQTTEGPASASRHPERFPVLAALDKTIEELRGDESSHADRPVDRRQWSLVSRLPSSGARRKI
jgi:predicted peptidase